jgi:hypothetical protein
MKFDELIEFLETKMSMRHIYQPLLIKTLVEGVLFVEQRGTIDLYILTTSSQYQEGARPSTPTCKSYAPSAT